MRNSIIFAAIAAVALVGCSSSSSTSSSGSTGGSTTTTGTTGSSATTTSTSGSSGSTGGTTGQTTSSGSSSGSGSSGGTTASNCQQGVSSSSGTTGTAAADFSCLGQVPTPQPANADITVNATLTDQNGTPIVGADIKVCNDATCATSLDPNGTQTTDAQGNVALTIPQANTPFTGYFDITGVTDAQNGSNSSLPMLVYAPPLSSSFDVNFIGVRNSDVSGIQLTTGISVQQGDGQIIGNVSDCAGTSAPGVAVSSSSTDGANTKVAYFAFNAGLGREVPSVSAKSTDTTGNWIIANVPPGTPTVTAVEYAGCTQVSSRPVITRAGTITNVLLTPQ